MSARSLLLLVLSLTLIACSGRKLTTEMAQQAVNKWVAAGTAQVTGVIDMPQENAAKADVQFASVPYMYHDSMFGGNTQRQYSGAAVAVFSHYNDGRWVLSQIVFSRPGVYGEPLHWDNLNITVGVAQADNSDISQSAPIQAATPQAANKCIQLAGNRQGDLSRFFQSNCENDYMRDQQTSCDGTHLQCGGQCIDPNAKGDVFAPNCASGRVKWVKYE